MTLYSVSDPKTQARLQGTQLLSKTQRMWFFEGSKDSIAGNL